MPRGLHVTSTIFNERLLTVRIWDDFWGPPTSEFHYETRQLFNLSMGPSVVNGHVYRPVPQEHASELGHSPNVRLSQSLPQNTSENGGSTMILPKRRDFQWLSMASRGGMPQGQNWFYGHQLVLESRTLGVIYIYIYLDGTLSFKITANHA